MKNNFKNIVEEIKMLNELETKPTEFKIVKFNEEFGELCAEIIKKSKHSNKPFS